MNLKRLREIMRHLSMRWFVWGTLIGGVIGGLVTLFTAPKRSRSVNEQVTALSQTVVTQVEQHVPQDPVEGSLAAGKAAARRRREALGVRRD